MKTVYYTDELNDDFANNHIKTKVVDGTFPYEHKNPFWHLFGFIFYFIIAKPLVYGYCKLIFGLKVYNRKAIKKFKHKACFVYGNHTHYIDAFIPNIVSGLTKRVYLLVSPDTVSIPFLRHVVLMLGAIPVPSATNGLKEFYRVIEQKIKHRKHIMIYPEAHLWPYYTGIRNFSDKSFYYPARLNVPCFAITTVYRKRKLFRFIKKPCVSVYVSEPIYPNNMSSRKENQKYLRAACFDFMITKIRLTTYEYIHYEKKII